AVLICVARLSEIKSLVDAIGIDRGEVGILTSDQEVNGLGMAHGQLARVLFTTQQMIESRCRGRRFESVKELQYLGKPRAVRIWDEAMLPAAPLKLTADDLHQLI